MPNARVHANRYIVGIAHNVSESQAVQVQFNDNYCIIWSNYAAPLQPDDAYVSQCIIGSGNTRTNGDALSIRPQGKKKKKQWESRMIPEEHK